MRIRAVATLVFILTTIAGATVSVSSPTNGSTVSSSVHVVSTSSSSHAISRTMVYVDNNVAYDVASATVNTEISMSKGTHSLVVQSWDTAGTVVKSGTIKVTVSSSSSTPSVTVTSPANGSTVSSSVHVASTSTSTHPISRTLLYVDNKEAYDVASATVNTSVTLSSGGHSLVVQSWDTAGNVVKSGTIKVTVGSSSSGGSGGGGSAPGNAKKYSNINQMSGWDSCDTCAGAGGSGPKATHTLSQNISSPSLDGKAAQFYLKGSKAYSAALWWKQLGADSSVSNFEYDLYYYLKTPSAAQALEFDVNQSISGKKYIFGTQCDIKGHHDWDVYDAAAHKWVETGIACTLPTAYAWNHLTLEFQRINGEVKFLSVTLNGKKSYINKAYGPASTSASELNVAIQLDADGNNTPYYEWADKVTLSAW